VNTTNTRDNLNQSANIYDSIEPMTKNVQNVIPCNTTDMNQQSKRFIAYYYMYKIDCGLILIDIIKTYFIKFFQIFMTYLQCLLVILIIQGN